MGTQNSFEHPKHMFKLMDKKIIAILRLNFFLNWPYEICYEYCIFILLSNILVPYYTKLNINDMLNFILSAIIACNCNNSSKSESLARFC